MITDRLHAVAKALHPSRSPLRRDVCWTFVGNTVYSACQWALISVLAKLTTPEVVGEYALAVAVTAPLLYIGNFNVGAILTTDTKREFSFAEYRTTRLLLIAVSLIAAIFICQLSAFPKDVVVMTLIVAITQAADCMSELYRSVMLRDEQLSRIATSLMLRGVVSVASAAILLAYSRSIVIALIGMAVTRFAVLFTYDIPMGKDCPPSMDSPANAGPIGGGQNMFETTGNHNRLSPVLKITQTAFPLAVVTVLASLVINMPRYFIEKYAGHRQLGIFVAMWSMLTAGNMIAIALGQAIFPRLSKLYARRDIAAFKQMMLRALQIGLALGFLGVTAAIIAGRQILTLAYRAEYAGERWMFVAVMGLGTLVYTITLLGNVTTSARAFKAQALLMVIVATATLLSSIALVPRLGVWGAIWAVGIGSLTHMAGLVLIVLGLLKPAREVLVLSTERV